MKGTGMVIKTKELAEEHGWYWPNQFDNEANAYVHEMTTGPEILDAMENKLDHLFLAYGTGYVFFHFICYCSFVV